MTMTRCPMKWTTSTASKITLTPTNLKACHVQAFFMRHSHGHLFSDIASHGNRFVTITTKRSAQSMRDFICIHHIAVEDQPIYSNKPLEEFHWPCAYTTDINLEIAWSF